MTIYSFRSYAIILCLTPSTLLCETDLSTKVHNEIEAQLSTFTAPAAGTDIDLLQKRVTKAVKREIDHKMFTTLHAHVKQSVYGKESAYDIENNLKFFIYKRPSWPTQSLFFLKKDFLQKT